MYLLIIHTDLYHGKQNYKLEESGKLYGEGRVFNPFIVQQKQRINEY